MKAHIYTTNNDRNTIPPARIYYGRRRKIKHHPHFEERVMEFLKYRPGDFISSCECFNRRIASIEYEWYRIGRKTRRLNDIVFYDTRGYAHLLSGMGCVSHPETNEQIRAYWTERANMPEEEIAYWMSMGWKDPSIYPKKLIAMGEFLTPDGEPLLERE